MMWAPVRHATVVGSRELPRCLCGLLRRAVDDARLTEQTPGYKLEMSTWHEPNGVCKVCMAGAVMTQTFQVPRGQWATPVSLFTSDTWERRALLAINDMRGAWFTRALSLISYGVYLPLTSAQSTALDRAAQIVTASYRPGRARAAWHAYLNAADVLERVGL